MSDTMRPLPLDGIFSYIFEEYRAKKSIFDIPEEQFFRPKSRIHVFSSDSGSPVGPAAGPHTQLTQNILASYLVGGRYFELKTVQILDALEIDKPCIDVRDEGYNVEWSTEFTLDQAYDDYLKAWFLLHAVDYLLGDGDDHGAPSFHFNMSVGYDLEGIKTDRMDRFIHRLMDSGSDELFGRYREVLASIAPDEARGTPFQAGVGGLRELADSISPSVCTSVTLSTMHGCPPDEIEAICSYMLTEKKLDTLVKLNPTLLGFERVGQILSDLGYGYITLDESGFDHDLQYSDAVPMLRRLQELAASEGKFFGVKLSNTLAAKNDAGVLPGEEMYVSGRALYPLTIHLASKLAGEFGSTLPMSFSGGVSAWNIGDVADAGLRPITVATDLLRPGGYGRFKELAEIADDRWGNAVRIDPDRLAEAADRSLKAGYSKKEFRGVQAVSVPGPLPATDCFVAPCIYTCPIAQDVPDYIHLAGEGRFEEAFAVIYEKNPLPFMTGYLCDHACEGNCTRIDWEGAVNIREIKRIAAERGYEAFRSSGSLKSRQVASRDAKAAVVGAGPAGLAAASFLAREGVETHVFEREETPGGIVSYVIPAFRIPSHIVDREVSFLEDLGVSFHFGVDAVSVPDLKGRGFSYVVAAPGAELDRDTGIPSAMPVIGFLRAFRKDPDSLELGRSVAVIGAGDTAMDAARAAKRCKGVEEVTIIYRRSKAQMPALPEEYESAEEDDVKFCFLRSPVGWEGDPGSGRLVCEVMELGEPGSDGRPRPVSTGETEVFAVDTVITAVGEDVDREALREMGITVDESGSGSESTGGDSSGRDGVFVIGDAEAGASTIVKAIASARRAADAIVEAEGGARFEAAAPQVENPAALKAARDRIIPSPVRGTDDETLRSVEAKRCLGCRAVCLKCVEVCPNRSNTFVEIDGFRDVYQIVHLDAFCNECGNCATFCPWDGKPYTDKFTIFGTAADFENSSNPGLYLNPGAGTGTLRHEGGTVEISVNKESRRIRGVADKTVERLIHTILSDYSYLLARVDE